MNICRYVYILVEHVLVGFKGPIAYQWNFMCCMRDKWSPTLIEKICLHSLVMSGSYVWHSYSVEDINKLFANTYTTKCRWHVYVHKNRHWYMGHRWPNRMKILCAIPMCGRRIPWFQSYTAMRGAHMSRMHKTGVCSLARLRFINTQQAYMCCL